MLNLVTRLPSLRILYTEQQFVVAAGTKLVVQRTNLIQMKERAVWLHKATLL